MKVYASKCKTKERAKKQIEQKKTYKNRMKNKKTDD